MVRPVGVGDYQGRKDGLLLIECWCHHNLILVAPEVVRAGLTGSCGADDCSIGWQSPDVGVRRTRRGLWAVPD